MGSYYAEPPINPSPEPWSFPPPVNDASPNELRYGFVSSFSPSPEPWSFPPPVNDASPNEFRYRFVSSFSPEHIQTWYRDHPINTSKLTYSPPEPDYFSLAVRQEEFLSRGPKPDFPYRTLGEGLHELHNNSSSGAPKANDDSSALANVEGSWVNISDADGNKPTDTLYGKTVSDGCGDSNGKLTIVESMGTAAGAHNRNSKEKSSESKAAWNTSGEKEIGEGGATGEYHTCEELSGCGSCGNACYTCAEADHFARKCTLGADCGCSGHHIGGNSTVSYVV